MIIYPQSAILKLVWKYLINAINKLVNQRIDNHENPVGMKIEIITPIHKWKDKENLVNYRPITNTSLSAEFKKKYNLKKLIIFIKKEH